MRKKDKDECVIITLSGEVVKKFSHLFITELCPIEILNIKNGKLESLNFLWPRLPYTHQLVAVECENLSTPENGLSLVARTSGACYCCWSGA